MSPEGNGFHVTPEAFAVMSPEGNGFHVTPEAFAVMSPEGNGFHVTPEAFAVMEPVKPPVLEMAVRHNGENIIIPFTLDVSAPAFAIRWGGRDWYNPLVAPDSPKASVVLVRHGGITYALSL